MSSSVLLGRKEALKREEALKRGRMLEYITIGYNSLEGLVAVGSGLLAGSIALVGFGFDSAIEVTSGVILLWRLSVSLARQQEAETLSIRLVGVSFLALAAYVLYDAISLIVERKAPEESIVGIILAVLSLLIMPILARAKRSVAKTINSQALVADAKQTELCTYLSAILLLGLLLNALFGWWWADPLAALIMTPIIISEGIKALRGKTCCQSCH
ncbi:MAG: cation transporter [Blastocatellia bacterium]